MLLRGESSLGFDWGHHGESHAQAGIVDQVCPCALVQFCTLDPNLSESGDEQCSRTVLFLCLSL